MGDGVDIDTAVVADVGGRIRTTSVELGELGKNAAFEFGAVSAGRMYSEHGAALGEALKVVGLAFAEWAVDAEAFGCALQSAAGSYTGTDQAIATNLGGTQV